MTIDHDWHSFDEGRTLGTTGSEESCITADEEYTGAARITLESGGRIAPWSITCGVYGWMMHTRFLGEQVEADKSYRAMKAALVEIVELISEVDTQPSRRSEVYKALDKFVGEFP